MIPQTGVDHGNGDAAACNTIAVQCICADNRVVVEIPVVIVVTGYELCRAVTYEACLKLEVALIKWPGCW